MSYVYARIGLDRFSQDLAEIIHTEMALLGVPRAMKGSINNNPGLDSIGYIPDF